MVVGASMGLLNWHSIHDTKERLRQSEERYRGVVESQTDLVLRIDPTGCFTFVNDAYCQKTGKTDEDLIGSPFHPFVHPDDLQDVVRFVRNLSKPPYRGFLEHRSWFKGEWRLTLWEGYAIRDADNQIIEFQGVGRDVSHQREIERALRESEQKFRAAFENSPIAHVLVDLKGKVLRANSAMTDLLGFTAEELQKMTFMDFTLAEDRHMGIEALADLRSGNLALYRTEKRYVHKSGKIIYAILASSSILDEAGKPMYLVSQIIDISERIHQENLLKRHASELTRSNKELAEFAYVVSHDIREPLRMISNFVELLMEEATQRADEKSVEYARFALEGAQRAQSLIHDLLSLARLDRHESIEGPVDLNHILLQVQNILKTNIQESQACIEIVNLPSHILGSESRFIQIFQNLIDNAIKYRSQQTPKILVRAIDRKEDWLIEVDDNGIGIEPQFRERVFQMFQRLHARGDYSGTGMGLAIVKKIIEARGGKVWIENSHFGKGVKVVFNWPKNKDLWFGAQRGVNS